MSLEYSRFLLLTSINNMNIVFSKKRVSMIRLHLSRFFSFLLSCALLVSPLPLSAMAQEIIINMSASDTRVIIQHPDESYIYLGKDLSAITQLISDISYLDGDNNSPIHRLKEHIASGFNVAQYDSVIEALACAEIILQRNYNRMNNSSVQQMSSGLERIINQVKVGLLTIDAQSVELARSKRSYSNVMKVQGLLSVNDQLVQNITAVNLSATDAIMQNIYVTNVSVADQTVTLLSATDAVITNIEATNISVVDQSVSGDLSVNDVIVNNYINFLAADSVEYVGL
jgi:hypothetical protein